MNGHCSLDSPDKLVAILEPKIDQKEERETQSGFFPAESFSGR